MINLIIILIIISCLLVLMIQKIKTNKFLKIVYINLDHRKDRKEKFLKEANEYLSVYKNNIYRFSAIKHDIGYIGCFKSHINVLKEAILDDYEHLLIFEDDFEFIVDKKTFEYYFNKLFSEKVDFNVVFLSYNSNESVENTNYDFLLKAKNVQTASGYLIHKKYYKSLLSCLEEGFEKLQNTNNYALYANDQYWKKLQHDKWFIFKKRIGRQAASHSDIVKQFVNYNV